MARGVAKECASLALLLALCGPAQAQPATPTTPEKVIVTAPRLNDKVTPNAIAHDFILHYAAPTILRDAIPRWQVGICPEIRGLADEFAAYAESRIRQIAMQAGAPLKAKGCRPDLSIVFTSKPQAYLDDLRSRNYDVVGYHGATTVTHPVEAWYVTGTRDIRGQVFQDKDYFGSVECKDSAPPFCSLSSTSNTPMSNVGGWRFHPDATSDLLYVTIIVDSAKTGRYQVGEIADYVAMMALTQTKDSGSCAPIATIANLLSPDCVGGLNPEEITATDIAFLRGVYKMDAGATLTVQQDQIAAEMAKTLEGR
jgi:hypothetical protein